ncbi:hypothetical protein [Pseudomonas atacamensis]|uniref:hypothetical protein n=1 Tax=Pseudomonas atacamensis TaxID=2565368 RepID=UPI002B1E0560|nr:hypothetical protein [Pseudomonas atacamensis]
MSPPNNISALFDDHRYSIIADSDDFLEECKLLGLDTANISLLKEFPANCIVFSFTNEAAKKTFEIAKKPLRNKIIFCATQVFEPSVRAAIYSLDLLLRSDFTQSLSAQRAVLNMLNSNQTFCLSGNESDATVSIPSWAQPYALLSEDVTENFVQSVAEFFEVHYAHMNPLEPCPFELSGTLKISGILTVLRKPNPQLPEGLRTSLKWLSDRIAEEGARLTVRENNLTSLIVNNTEQIKLLDFAAGTRGLKLTEFAIGVNESISSVIDYGVNSQLNEGISGVHLAIGDGSSGYHIDFLSPGVNVIPVCSRACI